MRGEFFWDRLYFKIQVRKTNTKVILKLADGAACCSRGGAAMVAKVPCNLTPRHP
jgi:hypothetical protein